MAEEIIYQWNNPTDLVLEVTGAKPGQLNARLRDIDGSGKYAFRLVDANGHDVTSPLKLVSDTHIDP